MDDVPQPIIEVRDLVKRYRTASTNAVDGVSFEVMPGRLFCLLGPNGAGKTTTISILTTTLAPTSGEVRIGGHDLAGDARAVRRQLGIVFQQPSLDMNLSAEENVRFHAVLYGLHPWRPFYRMMPAGYRRRVTDLAGLLGLDRDMSKPVKQFSGGMRRKLEIVRTLMHQPRVLFLDEPTTGLDPESRRGLWAYLSEVRAAAGITIFLTTHYLDETEGADAICVMNHGRLIAEGSPSEVKARLVRPELLVDAAPGDRGLLRRELEAHGLVAEGEGPFRVRLDGLAPQAVIRSLGVELTELQVSNGSMEDAYLALVARAEELPA
jgi:ABC-2 type transport system ATP-binding protein